MIPESEVGNKAATAALTKNKVNVEIKKDLQNNRERKKRPINTEIEKC